MFPERIMLIWTGRLKEFDNTMEDVADILTKDSCAISRWTHLMQLVHITETPSDEASALLISVLPVSQEKGKSAVVQGSVQKSSPTRRPKALPSAASASRRAERDPHA